MSRCRQTWLPVVMTSTPALSRASAWAGLMPLPSVAFSPLAITASAPKRLRSSGSLLDQQSRPGLPITSAKNETIKEASCLSSGAAHGQARLRHAALQSPGAVYRTVAAPQPDADRAGPAAPRPTLVSWPRVGDPP